MTFIFNLPLTFLSLADVIVNHPVITIPVISMGVVVVLHSIFWGYPALKEELEDATDEDEKKQIRNNISFLVIRTASMIFMLSLFVWASLW